MAGRLRGINMYSLMHAVDILPTFLSVAGAGRAEGADASDESGAGGGGGERSYSEASEPEHFRARAPPPKASIFPKRAPSSCGRYSQALARAGFPLDGVDQSNALFATGAPPVPPPHCQPPRAHVCFAPSGLTEAVARRRCRPARSC